MSLGNKVLTELLGAFGNSGNLFVLWDEKGSLVTCDSYTETFLKNNELVSEFFIKSFNNETLNYKIIFNGSPNKFLKVVEENGIQIDTSKQVWFLN